MEIVFIACVHQDPRGFGKLTNLINKEKPSHIFIELSPWGLFFRKKCRHLLFTRLRENLRKAALSLHVTYSDALKHPSVKSIITKISMPYEFSAAHAASLRYISNISLVDSSLFSHKYTSRWFELIDKTNLSLLLRQNFPSHSAQVSFEYRLAKEAFRRRRKKEKSNTGIPAYMEQVDYERENWIFDQFLLQLDLSKPAKSMYVGGWRHFLPHSRFMLKIKRLTNVKPRIVLLSDPPAELPATFFS